MHDVRLLSVKHFTFRLIYKNTWYQWYADLQIRSPRNSASVGSVEKWVRANDMHCTCARRTGLQFHGLFLGGTHSARASQVYMRYKALMRGPFASVGKNCGAESAVDRDPVRKTLAAGVYRPREYWWANRQYTSIFDLKYRRYRQYLRFCLLIFTARWCHSVRLYVRL